MGTGASKKKKAISRHKSLTVKPVIAPSKTSTRTKSPLPVKPKEKHQEGLLNPAPSRLGSGLSGKPSVSTHSVHSHIHHHVKSIYRIPSHKSLLSAGSKGAHKTKDHKIQAMAKQVAEYGYPPPTPNNNKAEPFRVDKYVDVDRYPNTMPQSVLYGHYNEVADFLVKPFRTDLEKARAIFMWIVATDVSDQHFSLDMLPDVDTPLEYLLQILWKIGNHAHLFTKLCRLAKIPCVTIYGLNKSALYKLGEPMKRPGMCSQWNAIYINGNWRLIDIFWASTCVKRKKVPVTGWRMVADDVEEPKPKSKEEKEEAKQVFTQDTKHTVNEFFFLINPYHFIFTHLPDDPVWQLQKETTTQEEFEQYAYVRERHWQLGMKVDPSIKQCIVEAQKGEIEFKVNIPDRGAAGVYFHYLLFRQSQDKTAAPVNLCRYVFYQKSGNKAQYTMRFPVNGRFKFDIFGEDQAVHETFDLCVSFLIDCKEPLPNCEPFPDSPDIGWGAGDELEKKGMRALTHLEPTITTKDGLVEIRLETSEPMAFMDTLKNNKIGEELLRDNVMMQARENELLITMRLAKEGEYGLNLFGDEFDKEGSLANLCNYLIKAVNDNDLESFPKLYEKLIGKGYMADAFNVEAIENQENLIKTKSSKVALAFTADDDAELFVEVLQNGGDRTYLAKAVDYVQGEDGLHHFNIDLPNPGEYAVNVFARTQGDNDQVYHAYTYLIQSEQAKTTKIPKDKGDEMVELDVAGELAVIKLPAGSAPRTTNLRRKNAHDVILQDQVICDHADNEDIYYVVMPENGEYELEVFEENENGTITALNTYHITKHTADTDENDGMSEEDRLQRDIGMSEEDRLQRDIEKAKEARAKRFRDKLLAAIKTQDIDQLRKAIQEFEKMSVTEENNELKKAIRLLQDLEKFSGDGVELPDQPSIGWGCGDEAENLGLRAVTHEEPLIKTVTGMVELKFKTDNPIAFMQNLKSNVIEEDQLRRHALVQVHDDEVRVHLRLPEKGDYALNLFGNEAQGCEDLPNVANYLIKAEHDNEVQPFPRVHEAGIGKSHLADALNVVPQSHLNEIINTREGKFDIQFNLPANLEMVGELHNNEIDENYLAKCATINHHGEKAEIALDLPKQGEYALNLYVKDKNDPKQIHHAYTYLINSGQMTERKCPKVSPEEEEASAVPVYVNSDVAVIPIPAGPPGRTTELIRKNAKGDAKADQVSVERVGDFDIYTIKVADLGEYRLQVFDQNTNGTLGMVQEYQIISEGPSPDTIPMAEAGLSASELQRIVEERNKEDPLPDTPAIGWGPGDATQLAGLKAITHQEAVIETTDGAVEIRFTKENDVNIIQSLKSNDLEELMLKQNAIVRVDDEEVVVTVRVPDEGEYALKLYGDQPDTDGELPNVCNYLIKSLKKSEVKNYPKFHISGLGKGFFADKCRIKAKSHPGGKIQTDVGVVGIEFESGLRDMDLVYEICNNDLDTHLSDCVKVKSMGNERLIDLILPKEGEYALNVYARSKQDPTQVYHVHTYLIESFQQDTQNLPTRGPQPKIQTIRVTTDRATIKVPSGKRARTCELLKKNALGQEPGHVKIEYDNKIDIYEVKLPDIGEYRFDIFEEHGNGTLDHIRQFQIFRDELPEQEDIMSKEERDRIARNKAKEERRRQLLAQLQAAILHEDDLMLKVAMKDYEAIVDDPDKESDLIKARKLLEQLELARELDDAMRRRDLQDLQRLINKAEGYPHMCKKLAANVVLALKLLEKLLYLERLRHEVLKMDAKAHAEIRSYASPPPQINNILAAVLVLLGEDEKKLKCKGMIKEVMNDYMERGGDLEEMRQRDFIEWKTIVAFLKKMGKESLRNRIAVFRVERTPVETAIHVEKMLKKFTLDDVRKISAAGGTFYVWCKGMIEEVMNVYIERGGDLEEMRRLVGKGGVKRRESEITGSQESRPSSQASTNRMSRQDSVTPRFGRDSPKPFRKPPPKAAGQTNKKPGAKAAKLKGRLKP